MEHTVLCRNVSKVYRQDTVAVQALTDINLEIPRLDFVCLSGPSGSGKSTLLNLIGGLDRPTGGEILVDGNRVDQ
ncbi:MAG: ATP-binding cassette domain-containing protein, partial [Sulfuricaulis sp.]|nr:ATP-binding cassette domain-containing protein [Sulfuricaulis sp.]